MRLTEKKSYDAQRYKMKREQILEYSRLYRKSHPEKSREHTRRWRAAQNQEKLRERNRQVKTTWMANPENRIRHCLGQAKRRALLVGMEFNIALSDLLPLPEVCPVLGIKLNYSGTKAHGFVNSSPSIDRINSLLGYVRGNVRIISWRANRIKSDASIEELQRVLKYMEEACA